MDSKLVYDIGMHNGDDTAYYLSQGYRVIAIEASPDLVNEASKRFENEIASGNLEILNVAIADKEGNLDFYLNEFSSSSNSFDKSIATRDNKHYKVIQVRTTSIDKIMAKKKVPYYMKIDIEGHDIICLNSLKSAAEKPLFISAEVNGEEIILTLCRLGYQKFKLIDQYSLLSLEMPATPEYAHYLSHLNFRSSTNTMTRVKRLLFGGIINRAFQKKYQHVFKTKHVYGTSGPFGNSLPGKWVDATQAIETYKYYRDQHDTTKKAAGPYFWVDVHATC